MTRIERMAEDLILTDDFEIALRMELRVAALRGIHKGIELCKGLKKGTAEIILLSEIETLEKYLEEE